MAIQLQDRGVEFALVDVFGVGPLTGNPLAVVDLTRSDAEEAPLEWMRSVAREMNQAETTFVLPATRQGAHRRLRSFTAGGIEVFGAGHNALGAWWWLLETGRVARPEDGVLVQEIGPSPPGRSGRRRRETNDAPGPSPLGSRRRGTRRVGSDRP